MKRHLVALSLLCVPASPALADWVLVSNSGPGGRYESGVVYDAQRGVTLIYGGEHDGGLLGDTWEWDGTNWTQVNLTGTNPNLRALTYIAYNSDTGNTMMFGGYGGTAGGMNGTAWQWDGSVWTQILATGPSGRDAGAMAYDSLHKQMVIFGGSTTGDNSGVVNETWTFNGAKWTLASSSGPTARMNCHMAYDSLRQKTVLTGGNDVNGNLLGDTWEWDGAKWTQTSGGDLIPRRDFSIIFDQLINRTLLLSGIVNASDQATQGMQTWDGTNWRFVHTAASPMPSLVDPDVSYDSRRGRIVMFGGGSIAGQSVNFSGSTYEYVPEPRVDGISLPAGTPGKNFTGTVYLNGPAGADGTVVTFSSNVPSVFVTPSIRIPAGHYNATFTVRPVQQSSPYVVQITAATDSTSIVAALSVGQ